MTVDDKQLMDIPRTNSTQSAAFLHYCEQMRFHLDRESKATQEYFELYPKRADPSQWASWQPEGKQKDDLDRLISVRKDVRKSIGQAVKGYAKAMGVEYKGTYSEDI